MHNESLLHVSEICHLSSLILIFETGLLGNLIFNRRLQFCKIETFVG